MAVEKSFVVKNGLEVNKSLLIANESLQRVGVLSATPEYTFDVLGGIGATDLYVGSAATVSSIFNVGSSSTSLVYANTGIGSVGIGTNVPKYLVDINGPVSTGVTALFVHGDAYVTGTLNIGTGSSEGSDIIIDGNIEVIGISTFEQHVNINNTLNVIGLSTFNNVAINTSLYVSGISTFIGTSTFNDINVNGISTFVGFATFGDSVYINENLYVGGASTFIGIATFGDSVFIDQNLTVGGDTNIDGSVDIGGDLNISGITTFQSEVILDGGLTVNGVTTFIGITTFGDNVFIDGDLEITGDYYGNGSNMTGIVTQIIAGNGVNVSPGTGVGAVQVSVAASEFVANIAVEDNGSPLGAGYTTLNFQTLRFSEAGVGVTISADPINPGIATVNITPGISIGLAIALS